jgi:molybdate transport system regulatory protein
VGAEVTLRVSPGLAIVAVVTRESLEDLGLAVGAEAMALIKSSFVVLATGAETLKTSARNRFDGVVAAHVQGAVNDDVVIDLGEGKTLAAVITRTSAEALEIAPGVRVQAFVKASHVILAVA